VVDLFDAKNGETDLAKLIERYAIRQGGQEHQEPRQRREQNVPAFSSRPVGETQGIQMNRYLTFSLAISMTLSTLAIPLRRGKQAARGESRRGQLYYGRTRTRKTSGPGLSRS